MKKIIIYDIDGKKRLMIPVSKNTMVFIHTEMPDRMIIVNPFGVSAGFFKTKDLIPIEFEKVLNFLKNPFKKTLILHEDFPEHKKIVEQNRASLKKDIPEGFSKKIGKKIEEFKADENGVINDDLKIVKEERN